MMNRKAVNALAYLATSGATDDQIAVYFRTLTSDQLRQALSRVPLALAEADRLMVSKRDRDACERIARIIQTVLDQRVCVAS